MLLEKSKEQFLEYLQAKEMSSRTIRGYEIMLRLFIRYVESMMNGYTYTDELTVEHIEGFLQVRKVHGDQPISRNRTLYIIRSYFSFLMKKKYVSYNISQEVEPLKIQKKERVYLEVVEMDELLDAIDHPIIKVAAITLGYSGLRISELCNLRLSHVDLENGFIKVVSGKGNKDRTVPISEKLETELRHYLDTLRPDVDSDRFFALSQTGKLSPVSVNKTLHETTEKLGWKKRVTAHILRHSFASGLVKNNASIASVSKLLGHNDLRVTSIYIHQNMEQLQEAVNLL